MTSHLSHKQARVLAYLAEAAAPVPVHDLCAVLDRTDVSVVPAVMQHRWAVLAPLGGIVITESGRAALEVYRTSSS